MSKTTLITDPEELRQSLLDIQPRHAAIAYVGKAWRDLLGTAHKLEELVVSPTAGTNPWALEEICKELGWENVHFLERLHSKVYIGPGRVIIGSPNLSSNGFDDDGSGLFEAAVLSNDPALRRAAKLEFEKLRALARSEYPGKRQKLARIEAMAAARKIVEDAERASKSRMDGAASPLSFHAYPLEKHPHRIFLEWYSYDSGEGGGEEDDVVYLNALLRTGRARVAPGDWVLMFRTTDKGLLHKRACLEWMRVDDVRPKVGEDDDYVDQIAQKRKVRRALAPFNLTPELEAAFRQVMADFPDLLPTGPRPLRMAKLERCEEFLKALQAVYEPAII